MIEIRDKVQHPRLCYSIFIMGNADHQSLDSPLGMQWSAIQFTNSSQYQAWLILHPLNRWAPLFSSNLCASSLGH